MLATYNSSDFMTPSASIDFGIVAQEAGVSRTWLYNQIEIRDRIEELRNN
ncbi:hypothetical protein [Nostoc sp.]